MISVEQLCRAIFNKIYSSTREGYGIFYEDELLDILPEDMRTRETLEAALKQLVNGGNIDVKYAKGNAFCIMGLKALEESAEPAQIAVPLRRGRKWIYAALVFAAAFAGGSLGGLVAGII